MKVPYFLLPLVMPVILLGQQSSSMQHEGPITHIMINKAELKWGDAPNSLPAGAKVAVLSGDPSKPGSFSLRLMLPANYKVPPHTHPSMENVVVLEGTIQMGSGEKFDENTTTALAPGGFSAIPANAPHYVFTKEPCVLQIYAEGPFAITYINPDDDPRNKK